MSRRTVRALVAAAALTLAFTAGPSALEAETFGDGVSLEEATPIHEILADPDSWLGRTVRIEGGVLDVCPRKGCWIEVGEPGESIRIKVEDDVIVFPTDAKGRIASAEGVVEQVEMTRESYVSWLQHLAEERGEELEEADLDIGDGPYRLIRIRGTGAEIEGLTAE